MTQKYHLYRAIYDAQSLGLEAYGVAADSVSGGQKLRNAREVLARAKDCVYCMTKPEPSYLDDKISLDADGDLTN